jgi:hypothetical protein
MVVTMAPYKTKRKNKKTKIKKKKLGEHQRASSVGELQKKKQKKRWGRRVRKV